MRVAILWIAYLLSLTPVAAVQSVSASGASASDVAAATPTPMDASQTGSSHEPQSTSSTGTTVARPISWRLLVPNILHDQNTIWSFPLHFSKGQHLKPTLAIGAATGALIALDPYIEPYFRNNSGFDDFRTGPLRGRNTLLAVAMVPVGLGVAGLARHDSYAQHTALFLVESVADGEIMNVGIKSMTGRLHPIDIPPHGDFTHTWFKYQGGIGGFPSGHATAAFATASVLSSRYSHHRWVPWVAYTGATIVALSRIPDRAHFPSDVFVGAALGYIVGHSVVLRQQ